MRATFTDNILRLSGSSIADFQRCPWRFFARSILSREVAGREDTAAALFGRAVHAGLAALYTGTDPAAAIDTTYAGAELPQDEYRTPGRAREVITAYREQFVVDRWQPLFVERKFELPLGEIDGTRILWSGYIDLAIEVATPNGPRLAVVDHKTTARASDFSRLRAKYQLSRSIRGYLWAAEQLTGRSFLSAVANEIIVRPPTTKSTLPRLELGEGCRLEVPFSAAAAVRFQSETLEVAGLILAQLRSGRFARYDNCSFPSVCQYHQVCSLDSPADRHELLFSSEYTDRTHREEPAVEEESA